MAERIKPKPAAELAGDLGAAMADALVFGAGHRSVDAAQLVVATKALETALVADRRAVVDWYRSNVALLMAQLGVDEAKCRSCGAKIWWIVTKAGNKAPISVDGLNHFADCAHAKLHRRET